MIKGAVYSCITGGKDVKAFKDPLVIDPNVEYFLFTDEPHRYKTNVFQKIQIPKKNISLLEQARYSRYYRLLGGVQDELKDFDVLLYIDGYTQIIDSVLPLIDEVGNFPLVMAEHKRGGLIEEFKANLRLKKDTPRLLNDQLEAYLKDGYPKDRKDLWCCGVIAMNNKLPLVHEFNELWYEQCVKHSMRTQLSFQYLQWKLQMPVKTSIHFKYEFYHSTFVGMFKRFPHDFKTVAI